LLDQSTFNRNRLKAEKLIDSKCQSSLSASKWTRAALGPGGGGDALDLVSLVGGFGGSRRKATVGLAVGAVALVTAIDLICAQTLSADNERGKTRIPDYSNRTGLPRIAAQMRGAAAKDFKIPDHLRAAPVSVGAVP
jgi:hypothetical protein